MSTASSNRLGPKTIEILEFVAKIGACPDEIIQLVANCSDSRVRHHVRRLVEADYVRRVPMTYGYGSLVVATQRGTTRVGERRFGALRSVSPGNWEHIIASAWTAAYIEIGSRSDPVPKRWLSHRELCEDDFWRAPISYIDGESGQRRKTMHRPDLGVVREGKAYAYEVEIHRKTKRRVEAILRMYRDRLRDPADSLTGVAYVTVNEDVRTLIETISEALHIDETALSVWTVDDFRELAWGMNDERQ